MCAEDRLRGDRIWVPTLQGAKGRDEGSACSQALPFYAVRDFQIRQAAGRTRVAVAQDPSRANNAAMLSVEDRQGGGDYYGPSYSQRPTSVQCRRSQQSVSSLFAVCTDETYTSGR